MARRAHTTDFPVDVEGIGTFTFGRRKMADEIKIQVEYARITEGVPPTDWLRNVGGWLSTLTVLTVFSPEGWDIENMDPLDDDVYMNIMRVYLALRAQEDSFRGKSGVGSQTGSEAPRDNN